MDIGRERFVRMGLIKRLESLTPEAFSMHWRGPHGIHASKMPGLLAYQQNHVTSASTVHSVPDPWKLDGLSELWFQDVASMRAAIKSNAYAPLAADTPTVMTMPGIIAGVQSVRLSPPSEAVRLPKVMVVATRAAELAPDEFRRLWHADGSFAELSGIVGIIDTAVTHRERKPAVEVDHAALPVDGIVELWFANSNALERALASLQSGTVQTPARILSGCGIYSTTTHVIVAG